MRFKLDFREAIFGGEKEIRISHLETCKVCKGSGTQSGHYHLTCTACEGTGKVIGEECDFCNGKGRNQVTKKLKIEIPSGVDTGTRLRIAQQGDAGQRGVTPGDLYIYLFVNEDEEFKRDGINILSEIIIDQQQAHLDAV